MRGQILDGLDRVPDYVGREVGKGGLKYREALLGQFCRAVQILQRVVELIGRPLRVREFLLVLLELGAEAVDLLGECLRLVRGVLLGELERDVFLFELLQRAFLLRDSAPELVGLTLCFIHTGRQLLGCVLRSFQRSLVFVKLVAERLDLLGEGLRFLGSFLAGQHEVGVASFETGEDGLLRLDLGGELFTGPGSLQRFPAHTFQTADRVPDRSL